MPPAPACVHGPEKLRKSRAGLHGPPQVAAPACQPPTCPPDREPLVPPDEGLLYRRACGAGGPAGPGAQASRRPAAEPHKAHKGPGQTHTSPASAFGAFAIAAQRRRWPPPRSDGYAQRRPSIHVCARAGAVGGPTDSWRVVTASLIAGPPRFGLAADMRAGALGGPTVPRIPTNLGQRGAAGGMRGAGGGPRRRRRGPGARPGCARSPPRPPAPPPSTAPPAPPSVQDHRYQHPATSPEQNTCLQQPPPVTRTGSQRAGGNPVGP